MSIQSLKVGQKVRVVGFHPGDDCYQQRLLAMGLVLGTLFTVSRVAPFGDPIEIEVRGYALSLRKSEASMMQIEVLP